jgi:hypothetical protein
MHHAILSLMVGCLVILILIAGFRFIDDLTGVNKSE